MFCGRCRIDNQVGAQFCRACASPLAANWQPENPGQQNYQQPPQQGFQAYANPMSQKASGKAITSMILSISSLVLCCMLLSVPGMILGFIEMNAVRQGRASLASDGYAKTGFYVGLAGTVISVLFYCFYFLFVDSQFYVYRT